MAVVTIKLGLTIDGEELRVVSARSTERLSTVPSLHAEVTTSDAGAPEPSALLGKTAELTIQRLDASMTRVFVGTVIEATRSLDKDGRPTTILAIASRLFRLGLRADCHVFQHLSVPDIVKKVLSAGGIPSMEASTLADGLA